MLLKACCCDCCFMMQVRREQILSGKQVMPVGTVVQAQQPVVVVQQGQPMARQGAPTGAGEQADDPEAIWTSEYDPESLERTSLLNKKE